MLHCKIITMLYCKIPVVLHYKITIMLHCNVTEGGHFDVAAMLQQHCSNISQYICNIPLLHWNIYVMFLQPFCAVWAIKNLSLLENRLEEQEISNDKACKKKIYKICNKYIINIFKFTKHTNKLFYFRWRRTIKWNNRKTWRSGDTNWKSYDIWRDSNYK